MTLKNINFVQWNLDLTKSLETNRICSLYRGSFSYILLLLGQRIPFVMSRFSLNRGSLNRGSTGLLRGRRGALT